MTGKGNDLTTNPMTPVESSGRNVRAKTRESGRPGRDKPTEMNAVIVRVTVTCLTRQLHV
jgi:hypothetical protein